VERLLHLIPVDLPAWQVNFICYIFYMMTMIVSDDEEFANCWRGSGCEYLTEAFVVVSLA
jgi:hypothetical protein